MAAISKRQQARNERELHDLLSQPGNNQCADCGARNPGWASWNLGIFVCMRCASLHRKLGTHISKVKSLSMDTWTAEQVETMRKTGNVAANKIYNPKGRKPDIPLDADEVDSAMERFIRKKYQEKSLSDGRPQPPQRDASPPPLRNPKSIDDSPPPPVPSKKGRFFGFGLRASSSAYPLSKHDKKKLPPEPRVDSAFAISSNGYSPTSARGRAGSIMTDAELQTKLAQLKDMGFDDTERNTNILKRLNGNLELTIAGLVKFGKNPATRRSSAKQGAQQTGSSRNDTATTTTTSDSTNSAANPSSSSNNPFDQIQNESGFGASIAPQPAMASNNPFGLPNQSQPDTGLAQSFQSLQVSQPVSQPLFPHSTGGYPSQPPPIQDPRFQYSMTPPVPMYSQQYGYTASPTSPSLSTNPFLQSGQATQPTGNNPFGTQVQQAYAPQAPSNNPFFSAQSSTFQQPSQQSTQQTQSNFNPFGIPPSQSPSKQMQQFSQPTSYDQSLFDAGGFSSLSPQTSNPLQHMQSMPQAQSPVQPQLPNFDYGQPQASQTQPYQQQFQNPQQQQFAQFQPSRNPYQSASPPQAQFSQFESGQPAPLMPQQTGRYDKNSILALYNYPQLAPQPLPSIPEPAEPGQQTSASTDDMFASPITSQRRSVTMPAYMTYPSGSNNPFLQQSQSQQQAQMHMQNFGVPPQHSSRDSVAINNLDSGRHSPDAFASLSARYMR